MSTENVSLVRKCYDAFRRRDLPTVIMLLHPEVEYYQSDEVPWGGRYLGHAGVAESFQKLTTTIESTVDPDRFVDAGDHVVAVGHTHGTVRATGKLFDVPAVHVWRLRDGKVV